MAKPLKLPFTATYVVSAIQVMNSKERKARSFLKALYKKYGLPKSSITLRVSQEEMGQGKKQMEPVPDAVETMPEHKIDAENANIGVGDKQNQQVPGNVLET
eukprot:scaffold121136_cov19-Prasinocladus_malaysianus.AAC.1